MIQPDLIRLSHAWVLVFIGVAWYTYRRITHSKPGKTPHSPLTAEKNAEFSEDAYDQIEPLADFDLGTTGPIKIRPFKPKYHLTMALENTTMSDLVAMDNTYRTRIALRYNLINTRFHDVLALNPIASPAVLEFYAWLTTTYLPNRFPTIFTPSATGLQNTVTGETLPPTPSSATQALELLGCNIDDDFLFLLPSSDPADDGKYRLEAFITCFPSGFNTKSKLNLKLSDIHGPVPGYGAKLEKSMDRFFAALPVGRIVKRHNWSITTHRELFCLSGTHLSEEEAATRSTEEWGEVDVGNTVLRCERQTLHRLPGSRALVFAYKTYQYDMQELRDEGSGEELARAIEGLGEGNVPGMTLYKRQVVWGDKVKRFLRGEVEG